MKLRKAGNKDVTALTTFLIEMKESLTEYEPDNLKIFRRKEKSFTSVRSAVKSAIGNKQGLFLVAESDGGIMGFAFGTLQKTHSFVFIPVKYGLFNYIWTKEEYREKGVATKLKNVLFHWFKKNNCK